MVVSMTASLTDDDARGDQVRRACIYMFCILSAFLVAGSLIMQFLGISIPGLRVAGGLVIAGVGFRMLFAASAGKQQPVRGVGAEARHLVHAVGDSEPGRPRRDRRRDRDVDDGAGERPPRFCITP